MHCVDVVMDVDVGMDAALDLLGAQDREIEMFPLDSSNGKGGRSGEKRAKSRPCVYSFFLLFTAVLVLSFMSFIVVIVSSTKRRTERKEETVDKAQGKMET